MHQFLVSLSWPPRQKKLCFFFACFQIPSVVGGQLHVTGKEGNIVFIIAKPCATRRKNLDLYELYGQGRVMTEYRSTLFQ